MHGIGTRALAGGEDLVHIQVGFGRRTTVQRNRGVGLGDERRASVAVGVDRHGAHA